MLEKDISRTPKLGSLTKSGELIFVVKTVFLALIVVYFALASGVTFIFTVVQGPLESGKPHN